MGFLKNADISQKFRKALFPEAISVVEKITVLGKDLGVGIYLVGGTVRDIVLGRRSYDVDVLAEKNAIELGKAVAEAYGLCVREFPKFGTCTLIFSGNGARKQIKVDIASAREETYAAPGALPQVRSSTVEADLLRRDFTVNSLAMGVGEKNFGDIIDVCGGLCDIDNKFIRVLHDKSFLDDPSRIFRAIRFSERLGFGIEEHTEKLITQAVEGGLIRRVRESRIKEEWALFEVEKKEVYERCVKRLGDILKDEIGFVRNVVESRKEHK